MLSVCSCVVSVSVCCQCVRVLSLCPCVVSVPVCCQCVRIHVHVNVRVCMYFWVCEYVSGVFVHICVCVQNQVNERVNDRMNRRKERLRSGIQPIKTMMTLTWKELWVINQTVDAINESQKNSGNLLRTYKKKQRNKKQKSFEGR